MKDNLIQNKSFDFALDVISVYKYLLSKKEFVLSKQLLRSGTSIGANIEEALGGQSKADFIAKFSIAYKEARETKYWLKLLEKSTYLTSDVSQPLINQTEELCRIISKILLTSKSNSN